MRNLAAYLKKYRKESIIAPLFKLLEALFDLFVPLVVARMIDANGSTGSTKTVWISFGVLLLMATVGLCATLLAQYYAAKASTGFGGALRQAMFDRIQSFSFTELDRLGTDTLITRLSDDVNQVQTGLNMGLRLLLRSPFIVFGSVIMAFTIDVRCALIFAVAVPILFGVVYLIMQISIPLFSKAQSGLDRVTAMTRENLTGVRVIRAFCREEQSAAEFDRSNRALTKLNLFVGRISALMNPLTYVLINIAAVVLIRVAGVRVSLGALPQGQVVALYNYMLQITVELIKLASLIITLNKSVACAKRASAVLQIEPSMHFPAQDAQSIKDAPVVEFRNVTFTYNNAGAPSLSDITFCAAAGQTVGIIGGTGSGKSTLVSLISRSYDATEGSVLLDGVPIERYTKQSLCDRIGVVPQRAVLFRGTIRENLRWGNENATDDALWEALTLAQAKTVVQDKPNGLDFVLEQGGKNLSGGQRQRLTIARALVKQPEILILDDSSSALDYATDAALRQAIRSLSGTTTTFLVSQRIACVRRADRIVVLDNGALAGSGTHDELMAGCAVYREIYYSQFPEERPTAASKEV